MGKAKWVKYKNGGGPRVRGSMSYCPQLPRSAWEKVMGVVARCEGHHDTVVMYDETGVTWGFGQWTFTSGRLQKLLESLKAIPSYDFENECGHDTLFDSAFGLDTGAQRFHPYGFEIRGGKFVELSTGKSLDPRKKAQKKRIADVCMGRVAHPGNARRQRNHAMALAELFSLRGTVFGVPEAQVQFAEQEFKRQLGYGRSALGGKSIAWLICANDPGTWEMPLAALFFNLYQNNPAAAYRLFLKAKRLTGSYVSADVYFSNAWGLLNRSKFGNWGWGKSRNKSPRVVRIKKAIMEFYGDVVDLTYYK